MKRSELLRRTALVRRERLRWNPPRPREEPGEREWKLPHHGRCEVCGQIGWLFRHHVLYERMVRRAGGDPWDLRNAMDVGQHCTCHADHHTAMRRIPLSRVPEDAIAFTIELLGEDLATLFFERYYPEGS